MKGLFSNGQPFLHEKRPLLAAFNVRVVLVYFFASTGQVLMPNRA